MRKLLRPLFLATALLLCLAVPGFGALSNKSQWNVGTGGSANNGGCYNVSASGTNRSNQDAAFIAFTDLVIGGTTTQATSALHPFGSTSPGNCVQTISGSGCTTGFFEIVSVSGVTATFDRSLGTAASTCTSNLGGRLHGLDSLLIASGTPLLNGQTINLQTGTYSTSVGFTIPNSTGYNLIGYGTTPGDEGTKPTITTATNSLDLILLNTASSFENIAFTNTATTQQIGINQAAGGGVRVTVTNCTFNGFNFPLAPNSGGNYFNPLIVRNSTFTAPKTAAIANNSPGGVEISDSLFDGALSASSGDGQIELGGGASYAITRTKIVNGASHGVLIVSGATASIINFSNNTIAFNARDGFHISTDWRGANTDIQFVSNAVYGNTLWGFNSPNTIYPYFNDYNAWGSNGSGNYTGLSAGTHDQTPSSNPFVNSAGGDYTPNSTAAAGVLLKGAGFPANLDIGAVQSIGTGGASASSFSLLRLPR